MCVCVFVLCVRDSIPDEQGIIIENISHGTRRMSMAEELNGSTADDNTLIPAALSLWGFTFGRFCLCSVCGCAVYCSWFRWYEMCYRARCTQ